MAEVNWDGVAFDAEHSPRQVLLEILEKADEIETLVVALATKPNEGEGQIIRCVTSGQGVYSLGLAVYAQSYLKEFVLNAEDVDGR